MPDTTPLPTQTFDIAVIGGGAVGLGTAMAIAERYRATLIVVEAESDVARHQTGNNSGVIHAGLYYKPGSLKAKMCAEGRELMYDFCQQRGIAHERCGKLVVATSEQELGPLAELERRGAANGLVGMKRLSKDQLKDYEPHVNGIAGLFVRETGIIDYKQVTRNYADVVREHGGEVHTAAKVSKVTRDGTEIILHTTRGDVRCRTLVNCGGLQSDRVARMCGLEPQVQIVPFRGEYYKLAPGATHLVRNLIYPVPNPAFPFLGVHYTRMIGGGVEAGPNAVLALSRHGYSWGNVSARDTAETLTFPGFWKMCSKYWRDGFGEMHRSLSKPAFVKALQKLIPTIRSEDLAPGGAGVRAQAMERSGALVDDFRIQHADRMVHVLNAPSPGATASIAIGRHIATIVGDAAGLARRSSGDANHAQGHLPPAHAATAREDAAP